MGNTFGSINAIIDKSPNIGMMHYPFSEEEVAQGAKQLSNFTQQQVKLVGVQNYPNPVNESGSASSKQRMMNGDAGQVIKFSTVDQNMGEYMLRSIDIEN